MKFIRKGTGRPFPKGQFVDQDLECNALPGVTIHPMSLKARVDVRSGSTDSTPYRLLNFQDMARRVAAGLDSQGRPSFLTIEETGDVPNWGISIYSFSEKNESHVEQASLLQSENYVNDIMKEYFVAQWSLVEAPTRKGLFSKTRALYELTAAYALSSYRAEGLMHVCLGDLIEAPTTARVSA
jgi:hypothetical protein